MITIKFLHRNWYVMIHDSHCHYSAVINDLRQQKITVPAILPEDIAKLVTYRKFNPYAKIGVGLHPWYIAEINRYASLQGFADSLETLVKNNQPDCIGETGLDKNRPDFELQEMSLQIHLELASKYQLPIVIHCVRAINELLKLLKKFSNLKGIIHAYNGNGENARQLWKHGLYIGVGSIIMNSNSQLCKSIVKLPNEQIILESDAPYMPVLGKDESSTSNCLLYAEMVSQKKGSSLFQVVNNSNKNWDQLFNCLK